MCENKDRDKTLSFVNSLYLKTKHMKTTILVILIGIISSFTFAQQDMTEYRLHIKKGDSLYNIKDYKNSAIEYQKAFDSNDGKGYADDRYNTACSFALAGNAEKAFYHLFYSAEHPKIKYSNYNHITTDPDLNSLHSDKQWE